MVYVVKILAAVIISVLFQATPAVRRSPNPQAQAIVRIHDGARAACLAALTPDHRSAALAIVAKFDAQSLSYDAAGDAVADLLSDAELHAIQAAHANMLAGWRALMHRPTLPTPPGPDPMGRPRAGRFVIELLGDPGAVFAQMPSPPPSL